MLDSELVAEKGDRVGFVTRIKPDYQLVGDALRSRAST